MQSRDRLPEHALNYWLHLILQYVLTTCSKLKYYFEPWFCAKQNYRQILQSLQKCFFDIYFEYAVILISLLRSEHCFA